MQDQIGEIKYPSQKAENAMYIIGLLITIAAAFVVGCGL